jgi:hypothetical protein
VTVNGKSRPVGFPRRKRPFELTLSSEGLKIMSRAFIPPATDPSLTGGKVGGGGSPEYATDPSATDPSPARDDERGRLTETARRGVEGVVIEKGFSKTFLFRL